MKNVLPLFIFIDACGWEIIRNTEFCRSFAPERRRLTSVFGYSSACVPSILSGAWPASHRNWCYFVYDPNHSPFKALRMLRWLPSPLTSRRFFRRWLSVMVKRKLNFKGYFDLYNIPFEHISLYDFTEKKSPLRPGGMNSGENIFDYLVTERIPYHVSEPQQNELKNLEDLVADIQMERIDFAFLYWPGLDGLLHRVGNQSHEIQEKLLTYEKWINDLLEKAESHYQELRLFIFSDHGMANCEELLDLKSKIEALGLRFGKDYAVVYDSTMARFWFLNSRARETISKCLENVPQGWILSDDELDRLQVRFADRYFGELIFLVKEGVLIVPSHMGERPIRAMHGYHPSEPHSYAALLTNQASIQPDIDAIPDIFRLMVSEAKSANSANAPLDSRRSTFVSG